MKGFIKMKKLLIIALCLALMLCFVACNKDKGNDDGTSTDSNTNTETVTSFEEMKTNLESNGYVVEIVPEDEITLTEADFVEYYGLTVEISKIFYAEFGDHESQEYKYCSAYEFATEADAKAFYDVAMADPEVMANGLDARISGKVVVGGSAEAVNHAFTKGTYTGPVITAKTYYVTVCDQDGNPVEGAVLAVLDENGDYIFENDELVTFVTDANGTTTVKHAQAVTLATFELPEYHINIEGSVALEDETEIAIQIQNNEPNGITPDRAFPFDSEKKEFDITIEAGTTVYYVLYGKSGNTIEVSNASELEFMLADVDYTADENGLISLVIPDVEASSRAQIVTFTNTTDSELTVHVEFISPLGSYDNPYEVTELGTVIESIVIKETTVYYVVTATKDGVLAVSSESEGNSIHMQNLVTNEVSSRTSEIGGVASVTVTAGDTVRIYVESLGSSNYNSVDFIVDYEPQDEPQE